MAPTSRLPHGIVTPPRSSSVSASGCSTDVRPTSSAPAPGMDEKHSAATMAKKGGVSREPIVDRALAGRLRSAATVAAKWLSPPTGCRGDPRAAGAPGWWACAPPRVWEWE